MGILTDYSVDRATLDVLAGAGIIRQSNENDDDVSWIVFGGMEVAFYDASKRDTRCYNLPSLTDALLRFIEAEGLELHVDLSAVWVVDPNTQVQYINQSLPAAVADYIKRKGE